jgi:hypothetical protein
LNPITGKQSDKITKCLGLFKNIQKRKKNEQRRHFDSRKPERQDSQSNTYPLFKFHKGRERRNHNEQSDKTVYVTIALTSVSSVLYLCFTLYALENVKAKRECTSDIPHKYR